MSDSTGQNTTFFTTEPNRHKKIVLVTGASGLVGAHLVQALIEQGQTVKALYRTAIPVFKHAEKVAWVKGDILDIASLEEAMEGVQLVYHCAAIVSHNPSHKRLMNDTNIEGTINVVNACLHAGIEKLLYVSSVSVFGRMRTSEAITEHMKWSKETNFSEYGRTKYLAEMEVWRGVGEGLHAVIVNPSIILGAADWSKGSSAIFKKAYNEFSWYTEGVMGFVDVADVVRAMVILMHSDVTGERFIVSAENIAYRDLFTMIAKAFHRKPPNRRVTAFIAGVVWRLDALKSIFNGSQPLITKDTALAAQAKVYFDNSKMLQYVEGFTYTPIQQSVNRICNEYRELYNLH